MRILHVVPNPFFIDRGGLVRVLEEIRQGALHGFECYVCCYHLGRDVPEARIDRIPNIPWYRNLAATANVHRLYLDMLLMMRTWLTGRQVAPDLIHAHQHEGVFAALPLSRWQNIPLLFDAQGSMTGEMRTKKFRGAMLFAPLEGILDRAPDRVIGSSLLVLKEMQERFRVPSERLLLLEDGVDTESFKPQPRDPALVASWKIPSRAPVVGYLGLLNHQQGIDLLLEVAQCVLEKVPETHFLIMGFPNEQHWQAKAMARGLGQLHFTGRVNYEDAPRLLTMVDVAISPKRFGGGEGNGKLLNYLAMALPVVAFDHPVNRAILGELGRYAPLGDTQGMANRVVELLKEPKVARSLGAAGRLRACERFTWERSGAKLAKLYTEMINSSLR